MNISEAKQIRSVTTCDFSAMSRRMRAGDNTGIFPLSGKKRDAVVQGERPAQ